MVDWVGLTRADPGGPAPLPQLSERSPKCLPCGPPGLGNGAAPRWGGRWQS
ncbi:MAG: hypothetical protein ACK559_26490 [bacterium]